METRTFIASGAILSQRELTRMVNEVSDDVVGFGPIEFLLKNPDATEVMVNGPDDVYVEREGRIEREHRPSVWDEISSVRSAVYDPTASTASAEACSLTHRHR